MTDPIKILLVEDLIVIQHAVRHIMQEAGVEMTVAETGEQALELIKDNDYDLIFMDIGLPDMPGTEVTKQIRAQEKDGKHIPIITLTANRNQDDFPGYIDAGMDEVIVKPLTPENARTTFAKYVQHKPL